MCGQWGRFTICVWLVRKIYHMCVVSEEGLPYVRSVRKVYHMCVVSEEGLPYVCG